VLSLVLPTYNEAENLRDLLTQIGEALRGIPHEIIVMDDDSPDGTHRVAQEFARERPHVHAIRRIGRRGLATAVVEGFHVAQGEVFAVMDADGQHDPLLLRPLYEAVRAGADIALTSRYREGGRVDRFAGYRLLLSKLATALSRSVCPVRVSDPLSGFFAVRRETFLSVAPHLRPRGFKILLELLSHLPRSARVAELPLVFGVRRHGESKLSMRVQYEFLGFLLEAWLRQKGLILFVFLSLFVAVWIGTRLWSLRLLYANPAMQLAVQDEFQRLSAEEGWLLSDLTIAQLTEERMRIIHREHRRGPDPRRCFVVQFRSHRHIPC